MHNYRIVDQLALGKTQQSRNITLCGNRLWSNNTIAILRVAEAKVLLVEPRGVVNTGDTASELTAAQDIWV